MNDRSDLIPQISMLDCPDEILTNIISHLNARERRALGKTCKKLNSLIFDDKKYFRELDFSEEGYLTSVSDVREYFTDPTKLEYIHKINLSNVYCTNQEQVLLSISKAENLVEVNITGFKFQDFKEFGQFLEPLKQLKKLSADWPTGQGYDSPWNEYLKKPFGRLTYLSMTICKPPDKWTLIDSLELCQKLEELYLLQTYLTRDTRRTRFWMRTLGTLENLQKVVICGCETRIFHTVIIDLLPYPVEWAKVFGDHPKRTEYLYLERNLEAAAELEYHVCYAYDMWHPDESTGWFFRHERLLREILKPSPPPDVYVVFDFDAKKLCFTSPYTVFMKTEDAKLLLENPKHQISYLNLSHSIESECDTQLIISAFPTLKKLVLTNIIKDDGFPRCVYPKTGVKRKRTDSEEQNEASAQHQTFKKFVDEIPNLQELTLHARPLGGSKEWDLTALNLIRGWKNLSTLYLAHLPIRDGRFLVEIGKQCTNLEKLRLEDLGSPLACCYKRELLEMLEHCLNLKDFSIQQNNFTRSSDLFKTLAGNTKLRRVRVQCLGRKKSLTKIIPPILKLVSSCNLVLLVCELKGMTQRICNELQSDLRRLKDELNRPLFQFEIYLWHGAQKPVRNMELEFVHKDLMLSQHLSDALYRLGFS